MHANHNDGIARRHRAVTLVEAIALTVLVSLFLLSAAPSLESLRGASRNTTCLDRLRAIAQATAVYSDEDPDEAALPVHGLQNQQNPNEPTWIGAYEWGGKSGTGRRAFFAGAHTSDPLNSRYGTKAGFGPASRPLNAILYPSGFRDNLNPRFERLGALKDTMLNMEAVRCPADDGPPMGAHCPDWLTNPDRSSYDHFGTSFAANVFMVGYAGGSEAFSNSPYLRPASDVSSPATTYLYEENIGRWAWASRRESCDWLQPGVDPGPTKAVGGWHGKNWVYNFAFVDGHAGTQAMLVEDTKDANGYSWHYRSEIVFPDDEEMQESLRCLIVRHDGWQKDTLPAELMPTGLFWNGDSARASYEDCVDGG